MSSAKDTYLSINRALCIKDEREKKRMAEMILLHYYGLETIDIALDKQFDYNKHQIDVRRCVELVNQQVPIQQILGKTNFYGLDFLVNRDVLIPRPETEELVDLILSENKDTTKTVLDVGSGSGCIPISLKVNRPSWQVKSIDVSDNALKVANDNAELHKVDIEFVQDNVLMPESFTSQSFDVIVSNPPYITEKEKIEMHPNVLNHEPSLALFVSNHDPLVFYRAILHLAKERLNDNGRVYFEINEYYGIEMIKLCSELGFEKVKLRTDLSGKDRIISCVFSRN